MVKVHQRDKDGEFPPLSILNNRHEAWAWDEEKKIRFNGKQKSLPTYQPTYMESAVDPLLRRIYFGRDPTSYVMDRVKEKQRLKRLTAENVEKHASVINA
jgi:hypothetical protein